MAAEAAATAGLVAASQQRIESNSDFAEPQFQAIGVREEVRVRLGFQRTPTSGRPRWL